MKRLSRPIGQLQAHYDVLIVGSGYGGAVAASQLARVKSSRRQRKPTICVLERGDEWHPGSYPDRLLDAVRQMQVDSPRGHVGSPTALYDFHFSTDLSVLVGCGLGGTSLINANVVVPPTPAVLEDERWPAGIRGSRELREGCGRAIAMLRPRRYPRPALGDGPARASENDSGVVWPPLDKRDTIRTTASVLSPLPPGFPADPEFSSPLLAIAFATGINHVGIQEKACNLCGNCVTGCNFAAKKTLIMNYLPDARNHGAEIYCGVAVRWLERWPAGEDGHWVVHCDLPNAERERFRAPEMFVTADRVILAAGSLGSTEILLRSRTRGLQLSERLGHGFNGNADFVAFGYNLNKSVRAIGSRFDQPRTEESVGPTITSLIDARTPSGPGGIVIQEGAIPGVLSAPLRLLFPIAARTVGSIPEWGPRQRLQNWGRELNALITGARRGAIRNTQTLLVMGHEDDTGSLVLQRDRLRVIWKGVGSQRIFQEVKRLLYRATTRQGGVLVKNPFWSRSFGRRLFTVHPLGGCGMGETHATGVVDHKGQVFNCEDETSVHPNLYVCDGAVVPMSLGANPLLTICAVAERTALLIRNEIESYKGARRRRRPNENQSGSRRRDNALPDVGVRFSERMTGTFSWEGDPATTFPIEMIVTANTENLESMLRDQDHTMELLGTVRAPELSRTGRPLTITDGSFNLFGQVRDRVEQWRMGYRMTLTSVEGRTFCLHGDKALHDDAWIADAGRDLTRLPITVEDLSPNKSVRRIGYGAVRIRHSDLWRIATSVRVTGARSRLRRYRARLRFARFYAGRVARAYGWPFGSVDVFNAEFAPQKRPLKLVRAGVPIEPFPEPTKYEITTEDGAQIRLTRYVDLGRKDDNGAVILAPGFGMSTYSFVLPTIEQNLTEYLVGLGYDVWLLDYRASEFTPSSRSQFTIDDIAKYDYPAAVAKVITVRREEAKENRIPAAKRRPPENWKAEPHVLGHCVGSLALLMALLRGYLAPLPRKSDVPAVNGSRPTPRVRSVICSQSFTHMLHPRANQLKAHFRLADVVRLLRAWPTLTSDFDTRSRLGAWIWDRILHFYPSRERCRNPVCRRNLFLYGQVVRHDQLNTDTHNVMYDMFDIANLTSLQQLQRMVRAGRIVDAGGEDTYIDAFTEEAKEKPEIRDRLRLPIKLLQGMGNRLFLPIGGEQTLTWLRENGDKERAAELYRMDRIAKYGHLDLFVGRHAATDIFPLITDALEEGARLAEGLTAP